MVLKTEAKGLGFQHLPRDLVNVNSCKTMFDPCSKIDFFFSNIRTSIVRNLRCPNTYSKYDT